MAADVDYIKRLARIIVREQDRLETIDKYHAGDHRKPYMPDSANAEYKMLAERCITNWGPVLVGVPAQALYVDNFRRSTDNDLTSSKERGGLEWKHWQRSRLDARQASVYRDALKFGHAFAYIDKDDQGRTITKTLDTMSTAALYEDPANDIDPIAVLSILSGPKVDVDNKVVKRGKAIYWDETDRYDLSFESFDDGKFKVEDEAPHGVSRCPVTRWTCYLDLQGRTIGVVEPMIELQDRINQTVFDLLVAQTYGSFKVRTATGMAPPIKYIRDQDGNFVPATDGDGNPIPDQIQMNASRFMFAEDKDVKFGTLDETSLSGYIESIDMSIRHIASLSQTPPHHLLGQMANLSAEALAAAETGLRRKVTEFQYSFGESWERHLRLVAEIEGDASAADDFNAEVIWRDMSPGSFAQTVDGLVKLNGIGIPPEVLVKEIPGMTQNKANEWSRAIEDNNLEGQFLQQALPASGSRVREANGADTSPTLGSGSGI